MEDTMVEPMDSAGGETGETSFLPLLLLAAALAAAYWMWSSTSGGSSAQPATAVPDAEELRRRRLEALAKSAPAPSDDGLRKRSVKAEETEVKAVDAEPKVPKVAAPAEPKAESKAKAPEPKVEVAKPIHVKPENNQKPNEPEAKDPSPTPPSVPPKDVPKVVPATLALRARATLKGTSHVRNVEVRADATVQQLQSEVSKAFPEAADSKARIFFNGKELKTPTERLDSLAFSNNICLQVMFVSFRAPPEEQPKVEVKQEEVESVKEKDAKGELPPPQEEALNVRIQSTVKGTTSAFVIKELTTCSRVLDLEALSLGAFAPGDNLRPRLFFMGKELKDGDAFLGHVGLKSNTTATVQVMFAAGEPRIPGKAPISEAAPVATASAAAGGTPSPVVQEGTNDAVLAAAAAAGCNVSALVGGQAETAVEGSPAEAWRAMAGLEEQLSRETDMSEEASVRQASMMLRQLLTTATHDSNPGLMEFAQSAVPDLKMIWTFEPTREHLRGLLAMKASQNQA